MFGRSSSHTHHPLWRHKACAPVLLTVIWWCWKWIHRDGTSNSQTNFISNVIARPGNKKVCANVTWLSDDGVFNFSCDAENNGWNSIPDPRLDPNSTRLHTELFCIDDYETREALLAELICCGKINRRLINIFLFVDEIIAWASFVWNVIRIGNFRRK